MKKSRDARLIFSLVPQNNFGTLEISFGWLFAILAGIVIIFIAIYFSSRLINVQEESISAETGKQIGSLLNPLETGFESSQTTTIIIPSETKINNICGTEKPFGKQSIRLDQKNLNKWVKTNVEVSFYNKYIFSDENTTGKKFYIFSKQFNFPFKIADLIYITSADEKYCFIGAPDEINNELLKLNQSNILVDECNEGDIKVCFGSGNCEISVSIDNHWVKKGGEKMYFVENSPELMYAAIFSNKTIYECQLKRLMMRLEELSLLYQKKELLTGKKGCDNSLGGDLIMLSETAKGLDKSEELEIVKIESDNVDEGNNARRCLLW